MRGNNSNGRSSLQGIRSPTGVEVAQAQKIEPWGEVNGQGSGKRKTSKALGVGVGGAESHPNSQTGKSFEGDGDFLQNKNPG